MEDIGRLETGGDEGPVRSWEKSPREKQSPEPRQGKAERDGGAGKLEPSFRVGTSRLGSQVRSLGGIKGKDQDTQVLISMDDEFWRRGNVGGRFLRGCSNDCETSEWRHTGRIYSCQAKNWK